MLRSHYAPARPVALSETLQIGAKSPLSRARLSPCKALLVAAALRFCCVSAGAGYDERSRFASASHRRKAADFVAALFWNVRLSLLQHFSMGCGAMMSASAALLGGFASFFISSPFGDFLTDDSSLFSSGRDEVSGLSTMGRDCEAGTLIV